jgi:hypothetical protein
MHSFIPGTAPDFVQRLEGNQPAQAIAKKGESLPRVQVRQHGFRQVDYKKLEALVRFLAKAPIPARQLDHDHFDRRAKLFLPASKSGRSRPGVGTQKSRITPRFRDGALGIIGALCIKPVFESRCVR